MNKNKNIALIGMSGAGKTFWSRKLAEENYILISCDDLILETLFPNKKNCNSIDLLGEWLGYPWEDNADFVRKQNIYLQTEELIMNQALDRKESKPIVFDTTGSFIYCSKDVQKKLKASAIAIYIKLDQEYINQLLNLYLQNPRPIVWQNQKFSTNPNPDEIKKSYKKLLEERDKLYLELSDKILFYSQLTKIKSINEFLEIIKD